MAFQESLFHSCPGSPAPSFLAGCAPSNKTRIQFLKTRGTMIPGLWNHPAHQFRCWHCLKNIRKPTFPLWFPAKIDDFSVDSCITGMTWPFPTLEGTLGINLKKNHLRYNMLFTVMAWQHLFHGKTTILDGEDKKKKNCLNMCWMMLSKICQQGQSN